MEAAGNGFSQDRAYDRPDAVRQGRHRGVVESQDDRIALAVARPHYKRSLYLAAAAHPWLRLQDEALAAPDLDLAVLKPVFARQEGAEALAGGIALLQAFHGLLSSLIGSSLTSRLLDAVWTPPSPSSGPPAQDPSP
jgi:hypothetical protein